MDEPVKTTKMERIEATIDVLDKVPQQLWALAILGMGGLLCVLKHDQAGQMIVGGGLAAFQHQQ